jgi:hypothetical protein
MITAWGIRFSRPAWDRDVAEIADSGAPIAFVVAVASRLAPRALAGCHKALPYFGTL